MTTNGFKLIARRMSEPSTEYEEKAWRESTFITLCIAR